MSEPEFWPRSRIVKSRGNAFDLSLPGAIDWSEFHRAKAASDGAATLRKKRAVEQQLTGREAVLEKAPDLPRGAPIRLAGSKTHRLPAHLHRARAKS